MVMLAVVLLHPSGKIQERDLGFDPSRFNEVV
jgi:hypothetical protein